MYTSNFQNENIFDVTAYGAVGNDTHDDTTGIQSAFTAAAKCGGPALVFFPPGRTDGSIGGIGKYVVSFPSGSLNFDGRGRCWCISVDASLPITICGENSTIRMADDTFDIDKDTTALFGILPLTTDASTLLVEDLIIDGAGDNQRWEMLTEHSIWTAFAAVGGEDGEIDPYAIIPDIRVIFRNCRFQNWTMVSSGTVHIRGITVSTFGFAKTWMVDCDVVNCDYGFWHTVPSECITQSFPQAFVQNVDFQDCYQAGVYIETASNAVISGSYFRQVNSIMNTGVQIKCGQASVGANSQASRGIIVSDCYFYELSGYPLFILPSTNHDSYVTDSIFQGLSAYSCGGGFALNYADGTCVIDGLTANLCAGGGSKVKLGPPQASIELGGGLPTTGYVRASNVQVYQSQTNGIWAEGNVDIVGGAVSASSTGAVPIAGSPSGRISGVYGFNPLGNSVVSPPFLSASGASYRNTTGVDCTVFLTTLSDVTITNVHLGTAGNYFVTGLTIGPNSVLQVRVNAREYIWVYWTPSTSAPTWKWLGD